MREEGRYGWYWLVFRDQGGVGRLCHGGLVPLTHFVRCSWHVPARPSLFCTRWDMGTRTIWCSSTHCACAFRQIYHVCVFKLVWNWILIRSLRFWLLAVSVLLVYGFYDYYK